MIYRAISIFLSCLLIVISPVLAEAPAETNKPKVPTALTIPLKAPKIAQVAKKQPSPAVLALIKNKALKYNLDPQDLYDTISCESSFDSDVQSAYFHDGVREQSFGLSQINLPSNPKITYEQAIDPEFAVEFMAYHFSQGHHYLWSCWKIVRPS